MKDNAGECITRLSVLAVDALKKSVDACDDGASGQSLDETQDVAVRADVIVEHQAFSNGQEFEDFELGEIEQLMKNLINLCEKYPKSLFAWIFESEIESFSPRVRRSLLNYVLGQLIHSFKNWSLPALVYLKLASLPGSISYQIFQISIVRLVLAKFKDLDAQDPNRENLVEVLNNLAGQQSIREKLVDSDLFGPLVEVVIDNGHILSEADQLIVRQTLRDAVSGVYGGKPTTLKADSDSEDSDFSETSDDVSSDKTRRKGISDENLRVETVVLKCLLSSLKVTKVTSGKTLAIDILQDLRELESKREKSRRSYSLITLNLLEHLCFFAANKAKTRTVVEENIVHVLSSVPTSQATGTFSRFCRFLSKLSQSKDQSHRVCAAHLAGAMFLLDSSDDDINLGVIELLLCRADDKAPSVRTVALKSLGKVIQADIFQQGMKEAPPEATGTTDCIKSPKAAKSQAEGFVELTLQCFHRRIADERPAVRKAAVQSLQQFLCEKVVLTLRGSSKMISKDFKALCNRSRDTSPLIRSTVIATASHIFKQKLYKDCPLVFFSSWTDSILPLTLDPENTVQKNAIEAIKVCIIENVKRYCEDPDSDGNLWHLFGKWENRQVSLLRKAIYGILNEQTEGEAKKTIKKLMQSIEKAGNEANSDIHMGAWRFLHILVGEADFRASTLTKEEKNVLSMTTKLTNISFLLSEWDDQFQGKDAFPCDKDSNNFEIRRLVLEIIIGVADRIPSEKSTQIAGVLFTLVDSFEGNTDLMRTCLRVMVCLCEKHCVDENTARWMVHRWAQQLETRCEEVLTEFCRRVSEKVETENEDEVAYSLFLIGELAILGFNVDDSGKILVPFRPELATLAMGVFAMNQDESVSEKENSGVSTNLRAHALVAIGKLCLRDSETAKKAVRMLVRELDQCSHSVAIRSNTLVILGDLCRRYTNVINPYMETISFCLFDPSYVVRRNALILFTELLQEDYIKWRCSLFVRYLLSGVDEHEDVRELLRYALKEIFSTKNAGLYHGYFIEVLFALNGCITQKHQTADHLLLNGDSKGSQDLYLARMKRVIRITSNSAESRALRMELYKLLLNCMSDTHKLEIKNKLCRDVIGEFLDGNISIPPERNNEGKEPNGQLLRDCFAILACSEIKVQFSPTNKLLDTSQDEEAVMDQPQTIQSRMLEAKTKVLSSLEKKCFAEHVVPSVVSFYRVLQKRRSPYLQDVSFYLSTLMKHYKAEVESVLATDKLLFEEILYDSEKRTDVESETKETEKSNISELQTPNKRGRTPSPALESVLSSNKKARRNSNITFRPSAKDVAPRLSNGVLRTPIPTSSRKSRHSKRRQTIRDEMEELVGTFDENKVPAQMNQSRDSTDVESGSARKKTTLLFTDSPANFGVSKRRSSLSCSRRWSVASSVNPNTESIVKTPEVLRS